ncbi:hypothetical protein GS597_01340 [Synechococcales cyanobacterium C]|uniref:DNA N-6-adenine-methyltransferase (Dam) n=1 Tax=Petrachloros mirabilis ULC683 TaxID=2781853 RepID=A0A8K1ZWK0_9CYAN|nr:DNA N-6-adenine-methyltransferase [Petrachloros mirabilis]NCJ05183.1 hypothetical protein [Petrachloros mirabilis ULC683]
MANLGKPLTELELIKLNGHEDTIERCMQSYLEFGLALRAILRDRLYRKEYKSFEEYCQKRWATSRQEAYRKINAAAVAQNLMSASNVQPVEYQTRLLSQLEPAQQRIVWKAALEESKGHPTGRIIEQVMVKRGLRSKPQAAEHSSESEEWYTPSHVLERVLACLGSVDLDPAAETLENPNVPANAHYTAELDGLSDRVWAGKIYLNPPYGRSIGRWVERLLWEYVSENVTEAILLVPARTDTEWWKQLQHFPVCLCWGRLRFSGSKTGAPFPSAIFYLGKSADAFYDAFADLGGIWMRISRDSLADG